MGGSRKNCKTVLRCLSISNWFCRKKSEDSDEPILIKFENPHSPFLRELRGIRGDWKCRQNVFKFPICRNYIPRLTLAHKIPTIQKSEKNSFLSWLREFFFHKSAWNIFPPIQDLSNSQKIWWTVSEKTCGKCES